jgi:hypothetical protein
MTSATVFQDGVWFDPRDRLFKMWYHAGAIWVTSTTAYAISRDGLAWERPRLDVVPGTNAVLPIAKDRQRDGGAVWLDHFTGDAQQRFKMYLFFRPTPEIGGQVYTSPDGIHWSTPITTSLVHPQSDNSTVHYNPFRKKWVYSLRIYHGGRTRAYRECDDLLQGANWEKDEAVYWAGTDDLDLPDPQIGDSPQLYNLDMIAYESLMLGVFAIHRGPANELCSKLGTPKITDLTLAYSRDGFHWHRPDRTAFLAATRKAGDWDRGYLHAAASLCTIVGDELYFYYGGWSGKSPAAGSHMYSGGGVGVGLLRRDGFVSMDAERRTGTLVTRPITFRGKHLLVNVHAPNGELRAELLDEGGKVIEPFSTGNCRPIHGDSTRQPVAWKAEGDLAAVGGRPVRLKFTLTKGSLYSFWVSPDVLGASYGYVAAGGPEFHGPVDVPYP